MKTVAMLLLLAPAVLAAQPASTAIILNLQVDGQQKNSTGTPAAFDSLRVGQHSTSASGSLTTGSVSANASGNNASATASLAARFLYVVAGADADSVTPATFTFTNYDTTPAGTVLSGGSLFDGTTQLYSFTSDGQDTSSFTYDLIGTSGTLLLNLNASAVGASSFIGGPHPTEITYPANATVTFGLTAPRSVGYILQELAAPSAVPEPASWALMIGGFGLTGGMMRRRVSKVTYATG